MQATAGLAGVILAAGGSARLGKPKQLVKLAGEPLIARVARLALDRCGAGLIVVTGAGADEVAAAVAGMPVTLIHNRRWREGLASSLQAGIARVSPTADAVLFLLVDQAAVTGRDLDGLIAAWRQRRASIAAAAYQGTVGVPAIFPREYWGSLNALRGDQGAKRIIQTAGSVSLVAMPAAAFDLDTPEQLEALQDK